MPHSQKPRSHAPVGPVGHTGILKNQGLVVTPLSNVDRSEADKKFRCTWLVNIQLGGYIPNAFSANLLRTKMYFPAVIVSDAEKFFAEAAHTRKKAVSFVYDQEITRLRAKIEMLMKTQTLELEDNEDNEDN